MNHFVKITLFVFSALNILDLALTYVALNYSTLVAEFNPFNIWLLSLGWIGYVIAFFRDTIIYFIILDFLPKRMIEDKKFRDMTVLIVSIMFFIFKVLAIISNLYISSILFGH